MSYPKNSQKLLASSLIELGSILKELSPGNYFGVVHVPHVGWRLFDVASVTEHTIEQYEVKFGVKFQPPVTVDVGQEYPANGQVLYQQLLEVGEFFRCDSDKKRNDFLADIRVTGGRVEKFKNKGKSKSKGFSIL